MHRRHVAQCLAQSKSSKNGSCYYLSEYLPIRSAVHVGLHSETALQRPDPSNKTMFVCSAFLKITVVPVHGIPYASKNQCRIGICISVL